MSLEHVDSQFPQGLEHRIASPIVAEVGCVLRLDHLLVLQEVLFLKVVLEDMGAEPRHAGVELGAGFERAGELGEPGLLLAGLQQGQRGQGIGGKRWGRENGSLRGGFSGGEQGR